VSPRPYWKGYLKLSLVSCPIAVHAACTSSERVSFRQINRKTGNRLRQQLIDEETREPVEGSEKARGYEIGKGQFLLVEDEELEAIEIESTHTIDIDSFVPRSEIDQRFFDTSYFITPNDPVGLEAFAVIREAMRSKALVALGRIVLSKRERVIALEPYERGLIGTTLHYAYEVRNAKDYFADIPELTPAPELLQLAEHILDSKLAAFDPSAFRDRYEETLMAHLKAKQAGMPPQPKQSWTVPRRAINLMEALRRSVAAEKKSEAPRRAAPAASGREPHDTAQRIGAVDLPRLAKRHAAAA
jgi:DNA end-binding protein Ku